MIVSLSGPDGVGKSTQIGLLKTHLFRASGSTSVIWYRPGYSAALDRLRRSARSSAPSVLPAATDEARRRKIFSRPAFRALWQFVAFVDSARIWAFVTRWHRLRGRNVILDRYLVDGELDLLLKFPTDQIRTRRFFHLLRWVCPKPDVSIVLCAPWSAIEGRRAGKVEPFPEDPVAAKMRFDGYEGLRGTDGLQFVDASGTAEEVHERIAKIIDETDAPS